MNVAPSIASVEILPAISLPQRRSISGRIGRRLIHPDRNYQVNALEFSTDGNTLIGSNYPKNNIQTWDVQSGEQLTFIDTPDEYKGSAEFWLQASDSSKVFAWVESRGKSERLSEDGRDGVRIAYPESCIQVWDLRSGELIRKIQPDPSNQFRSLVALGKNHFLTIENLAGTFFDERPRVQRILNVHTNQWTMLDDRFGLLPSPNKAGDRIACFTQDESKMYSHGLAILSFPGLDSIVECELPEGINSGERVFFCEDEKHILIQYRTYDRKGVWQKWKSNIACMDSETGILVGQYELPFENDTPLFVNTQMSNGTVVFSTWRSNPQRLIGLSIPDLKPTWDVELGEDVYSIPGTVFSDGNKVAVICTPKSDALETRDYESIDWDLVPQSDLKVFSKQGELLETLALPVGTSKVVFSPDGKTAAIGALGSAYLIDLNFE